MIAALIAQLRTELAALEQVTRMAVDEATGAESRAENKYDTRGLEASYLAAGQGERVVALRRLVGWLATPPPARAFRVGLGSLIELDEAGRTRWAILLPDGGGTRARLDGGEVMVLTPDSPLGRELLGREPGDEVEVPQGSSVRTWSIESLQ